MWRSDLGQPRRRVGCAPAHALLPEWLDPSAPRRCLGPCPHLYAPVAEVVGDFEVDQGDLDPTQLLDELGEPRRPAASPFPEDRLERVALPLVGALIHEESRER